MNSRGKVLERDRSMSELFQCIEQFAGNMEDSFSIINRNFTTFKIKLGQLKKRHLIQIENQSMTKREIVKKKAQSKINKNKSKQEESSSLKQQLTKILTEEVPVVTIDENQGQYLRSQSPSKGYCFQDATQNLQFEIDDIVFDEVNAASERQTLWNHFYQGEKARLQQLDPKASNSDIAKFASDKWNTMSELEKLDWKDNVGKKREGRPKKANTISKFLKEEKYENRFSDFLNKKANKPQQPQFPQTAKLQKTSEITQDQVPVSASQLISVLEHSKQKPQVEETLKEDEKLKRIFRAFEL